ncbi:MAG: hypothetical protein KIT10_13810 [Flavobacteriales bacterium]|nr:hypothetical protein [Flavobacteriales bacterium]
MKYGTDPHLVPLWPTPEDAAACPTCGAPGLSIEEVFYPGVHVMARRRCGACGSTFLRDLPVGFAVSHPVTILESTGEVVAPDPKWSWLEDPVKEACRAPSDMEVGIERTVLQKHKRVVILNTLDFLYGHVLLKLYNADHYLRRYPDVGLVVIVPRALRWLVPRGTAEVWTVDLGLGRMHGWYRAMDTFVKEQLPRFEQAWLGRAYAHPEFRSIRIERFTGVEPFRLDGFNSRPPVITFVAREDRLWFATPWHKNLYRVVNRLGMKQGMAGRWFVRQQDRLMKRTMRAISKRLPEVRFNVVGLGRAGGMDGLASDMRVTRMDETTERAWVKAYADSQLVVGVHGSNMLLPTAHAAGCIEILPYDRYGNILQDISVRWHDRMQAYLYRFVDEFARPSDIARHAVAMFREFENFRGTHVHGGFAEEDPGV